MATITVQNLQRGTAKTERAIGANKAVGWLNEIMAETAGTSSGEDALAVLNRKLESSGVLGSGSADPVFANESALFYLNTTSNKLFTRGTSSYDAIAIGEEEDNIIDHGGHNPPLASASTAWIYVDTSNHTIRFKERSGNPGSYTYAWTNPVTPGDYQLRLIYHTATSPSPPVISWNYLNQNFNITAGGWNQSDVNAKWMRIVALPADSNTAAVSPAIRIGDPTAEDISYTPPVATGNIPNSVNNVKEGLDAFHSATLGGGGGGGTDDQVASEVPVTTTNFDQNLSSADNNVQLALDTIDDLDVPPYLVERLAHTDNLITGEQQYYSENFSIPQRLRDYRDRFDQPLYIVADVNIDIQENDGSPGATMAFALEILDHQGMELRPTRLLASSPATQNSGSGPVTVKLRVQGVLPDTFNDGRVITECTEIVLGGFGAPAAGVRFYNIQVYPDASAIDSRGFDGNLAPGDDTVQDVAQKFDDYVPSGADVTIDASGFNGNLATTDDDAQKVAQKLDDLTLGGTQNASQVPIVLTPNNPFYDPNNFIGGIRGVTGAAPVGNYESNPNDIRSALQSVDHRLQEAYNPFQTTQLLDRSAGGSFTSSFSLNATNHTLHSSDVIIPRELRELGSGVDIRVRFHVQSISGFTGDVKLTTGTNTNTLVPGTDREDVNDTTYDPTNFVTFQRTVSAANVRALNTFQVRFERTAGTATFNQGFVDIVDSTGSTSGMAGGQASSYTTAIMWLAGSNINDRLTTTSESINRTLMSGHRFPDYDLLVFVFDPGAGSSQPLMPEIIDSNLFTAAGANGILRINGGYWLMFSRQSDTEFRLRWCTPPCGLRRIIGLRTN